MTEFCKGLGDPTTLVEAMAFASADVTWRVAASLDVLLEQINAMAPGRDKASDGSICDANHSRDSDHCPHDIAGLGADVVTARDFDHDPASGADMGRISEALRKGRDRRIAYVIFNRQIFSSTTSPWTWRPYTGASPHTEHMHISVVHAAIADSTMEWDITMSLTKEDIRLVSDATAAKVLGRAWSAEGRTLAGSVEALLNYHPIVMGVLRDIHADSQNDIQFTEDQLRFISDVMAQRLPQGGTFTLSVPAINP